MILLFYDCMILLFYDKGQVIYQSVQTLLISELHFHQVLRGMDKRKILSLILSSSLWKKFLIVSK